MKSLITTILLLLLQQASAQESASFRLLQHYTEPVADAQIDNLGNLYLTSEEGGLKKLSPTGDSLAVYNGVRRFGKLFSLDVSNPLKPVLFYKDFAQLVMLDRFLAQQAALDLRRSGIQQPVAASVSFDNKFWVFDAFSNKLKKVDEAGALFFETPDLRTIFPGGLQPSQIMDGNNWVYLYDSAQGLFVFDYYGNFRRKVPIPGWSNLVVTNTSVYGINKGQLSSYSLSTLMQEQKELPQALKDCPQVRFGWGRLVALCAEGVRIYSLP